MIAAKLALLMQGIAPGEAPPPPQSTCDQPVYMVVEGITLDRERMAAYGRAIAESQVYEKLGGYYINNPRPIEVFEGELPQDYVSLTVRFPCIENARAFWYSEVYQKEIMPIRLNPSAGDYRVTVYSEIPLRSDMQGKVEAGRYLADFSGHGVPQLEQPHSEEHEEEGEPE